MSSGFTPFAMLQNRVQPDAGNVGASPAKKSSAPEPRLAPGQPTFAETLAANQAAQKPKAAPRPPVPPPAPKSPAPRSADPVAGKDRLPPAGKVTSNGPSKSDVADRGRASLRGNELENTARQVTRRLPDGADLSAPMNRAAAVAGNDSASGGQTAAVKPLQQLADAARKIVKDSPVLNFLNGDFSRFDPEEITSFIADNSFLNKALDQTDFMASMNQPQPLRQILQDLQLSPELLDQIQKLGLNLDELATFRQIFEVLGMDPQQVANEIETLRSNLQTAGTTMYARKAARARAKADIAAAPAANAAAREVAKNVGDQASAPRIDGSELRKNRSSKLEPDSQIVIVPGPTPPLMPMPPVKVADSAPPIESANSAKGAAIQKDPNSANATSPFALANPVANAELVAAMLAADRSSGVSAEAQSKPELAAANGAGTTAQVGVATSDPFAAMGTKLDLGQTVSRNMQTETTPTARDLGTPLSLEALAKDAGVASSADVASPSNTQASLADLLSRNMLESPKDLRVEQQPVTAESENASGNYLIQNKTDVATNKLVADFDAQPLRQEMSLEVAGVGLEGGVADASGSGSQQGSTGDLGQGGSGASAFDQFGGQTTLSQNTQSKSAGESTFVTQLREAAATPAQIAKPVFESAIMMLNQGGGSIKLDLGSTEFGDLKVALNVQDQQLDLRILTSSQAARDLLSQELPRLRDSLAQHNLTLNQVQVGVGAESMQQQFANGGGRQSMQEYKDGVSSRLNSGSVGRMFAPRTSYAPIGRAQMPRAHSGTIQVAV